MGIKRKTSFSFALHSFFSNFGFAELTPVNYVFLCCDSAIQVYLMAFAAPSVREKPKKIWFFAHLIVTLQPIIDNTLI